MAMNPAHLKAPESRPQTDVQRMSWYTSSRMASWAQSWASALLNPDLF